MDIYELARAAGVEERRKQRREGILLAVLSGIFLVGGVFLIVVGNPWIGAIGIAFGAMGIVMGIVEAKGITSTARRWSMIVGSALFGLVGALMIVANTVAPGSFGWRAGLSVTIIGAIALVFFGGGSILLLVRELRRGRRDRP